MKSDQDIWIDINNRKPKERHPVMVKTKSGEYGAAIAFEPLYGAEYEWGWLYKRIDNQKRVLDVTHWCEMSSIYE